MGRGALENRKDGRFRILAFVIVHLAGAGVDADFKEHRSGARGEVDDRMAGLVPSSRQPEAAGSA